MHFSRLLRRSLRSVSMLLADIISLGLHIFLDEAVTACYGTVAAARRLNAKFISGALALAVFS